MASSSLLSFIHMSYTSTSTYSTLCGKPRKPQKKFLIEVSSERDTDSSWSFSSLTSSSKAIHKSVPLAVSIALLPWSSHVVTRKKDKNSRGKGVKHVIPMATDSESSGGSFAVPMRHHVDVFWHEGMLNHDTGTGVFGTGLDPGFLDVLEKHPENSDRVRNFVSTLKRGSISPYIVWHLGRPAQISQLFSFHTPEYINELVEADKEGEKNKMLCFGTFLNPGSWDAALLAAGTTLSAMKHVLDGNGKVAYALVRPPGHHAQPSQADGYCFLNNAGLAAKLALDSGCNKVAIIDIDVHHGNGQEEGFYRSDKVLTISLHMNHGAWGSSHPQSGSVDDLGEGEGYGYNLNIPLPNGTGNNGYVCAFNELVVPSIQKFGPDIIVLAVGLDSSAYDPHGRQCLTSEGYREIGKIISGLATQHSDGRLLIVQEGGYHITYAAYCLHALLEGILNLPKPLLHDPIAYYPEDDKFPAKVIQDIKNYLKDKVPFMQ